uniref:B30.2/SPRY domain-containing protein n=1 Tax=Acrobeloides nanus TaxID=290746 RepID=A0A914E5T1_9BILA
MSGLWFSRAIANCSAPDGLKSYYFEVRNITGETYQHMGIGLTEKDNYLEYFKNDDHYYITYSSINDVLGCWIDFENSEIFFTQNGEYLAKNMLLL